jgi:hypothetical protein
MPDWKKLVHERMTGDEDVIAELAAHLEETYEHALASGLRESDAIQLAQQEVDDWRVLAADIARAKSEGGLMNDRIKRLWFLMAVAWLTAGLPIMILQRPDCYQPYLVLFYLPWLAALPLLCAAAAYMAHPADSVNDRAKRLWLSLTVTWLGTSLSFIVPQRMDHPELVLRRPIPVFFSLPWLATLILVGAAGAYLAKRADAPRKTRLIVATSPALLLGIVMLLLLPWRVACDRYPWAFTFFAIDTENWAVVPGLALLLGALPFLWQRPANSFPTSSDEASGSLCSTALPG